MNTRFLIGITILISVTAGQIFAQSSGSSLSLLYGTVKAAGEVQAESRHAGGALLGGLAGAVIADDHRGLGALAGGLIGGGIEGHHTGKQVLQQYTVDLKGGGACQQYQLRRGPTAGTSQPSCGSLSEGQG